MDPISTSLLMGSATVQDPQYVGVSVTQSFASGSSTLSINKPAGAVQGDLMVAAMFSDGNMSWSGDTSWTEVLDSGTNPSPRVAYKVAGASEPASYSFTSTTSTRILAGVILLFRNCRWDTIGTISTSAPGSTQTAPQITVAANKSILIATLITSSPNVTWSSQSAGLVSATSNSDAAVPSFALYVDTDYPAGASGTKGALMSNTAGNKACFLMSVKPL
jgi:hypothetical protein